MLVTVYNTLTLDKTYEKTLFKYWTTNSASLQFLKEGKLTKYVP